LYAMSEKSSRNKYAHIRQREFVQEIGGRALIWRSRDVTGP